jgi:glycine cleavage system aminomethyltransferase T
MFPYSVSKIVKVAGHQVRAMRTSFVGELGWEIHIPWHSCIPVYLALWEHGKKFGMRHAGYRALYSLCSEKGERASFILFNFHLFQILISNHNHVQ